MENNKPYPLLIKSFSYLNVHILHPFFFSIIIHTLLKGKIFRIFNLKYFARFFIELIQNVYEQKKSVIWIGKTRYSSFAGTNLHQLLRSRHIEEVHHAGGSTYICVQHTASDTYNIGYLIVIHEHASCEL